MVSCEPLRVAASPGDGEEVEVGDSDTDASLKLGGKRKNKRRRTLSQVGESPKKKKQT